jgi:hypothetical protein
MNNLGFMFMLIILALIIFATIDILFQIKKVDEKETDKQEGGDTTGN